MSYTFCPRIDLEGGWCLGAQWLQLLSRPHIVHTSLNSTMKTISISFIVINVDCKLSLRVLGLLFYQVLSVNYCQFNHL